MIILDATTETLELLSSSAADLDVVVSFIDITTTTTVAGSEEAKITSATTTTILSAPAAATQRQLKTIVVTNIHATDPNTVTIKKDISGTEYLISEAEVLAAGEAVSYDGSIPLPAGAGSGDVVGPASSVDNEIVRFDGATGKIIQAYSSDGPTISDTGDMIMSGTLIGVELLTVDDITINANAISSAGASSLTIDALAGQAVVVESVSFDGGIITAVTGLTATGVIDFSGASDVRITPTAPTADSEIAVDIMPPAEFTDDLFTWWGGVSVMTAVALTTAQLPSGAGEDGFVTAYNATNDEFELVAQTGGSAYYTWNEETGTSVTMSVDNAYIANNASLVTLTLPTTAAIGDRVLITGKGAGGWRIAQNASEIIHFGNVDTTTGAGGRLDSIQDKDTVELVCVVADTEWNVISAIGNITTT